MNPTLVVSVSVLILGAAAAIFMFMQANSLTTDDISLLDACKGANVGIEVPDVEGGLTDCGWIEENGFTWDSEVPCTDLEGSPTFNMRKLVDAMTLDFEGAPADDEYVAQGSADYINDACFMEPESARKLLEGNPGYDSNAPSSNLRRKLFWNWGPCSTDISFLAGGVDSAECSGAAAAIRNQKVNGHSPTGTCNHVSDAQAASWRSHNYWMYQGCLNHDVCLVKGGPGYTQSCGADCSQCWNGGSNGGYSGRGNSRGSTDCDAALSTAAHQCQHTYSGSGKGASRVCKNAWYQTMVINNLMHYVSPNDGWCAYSGPGQFPAIGA